MSGQRMEVPSVLAPVTVLTIMLVTFNMAIAQPLLDLLGRNAEFFVAHRASTWEIVGVALAFALVIPLALTALILGLTRLSRRAGKIALVLVSAALVGALLVQVLKKLPVFSELPGPVLIGTAILVGVGASVAFARRGVPAWFVRVGWVVAPLVLALFLMATPASELVFSSAVRASGDVTIRRPAPVVVVVFDEFPVISLMDRSERVDGRLFPNFARLADDAIWFRNTSTSQVITERAVASVIASEERPSNVPIASEHPNNLFLLLEDAYDVVGVETVTAFCPQDVCRGTLDEDESHWRAMASDIRVVLGHLLLPEDLAEALPTTNAAWAGFGEAGTRRGRPTGGNGGADATETFKAEGPETRDSPPTMFERFMREIRSWAEPGERQAFVLHVLLPHQPWNYLPSGQHYPGDVPGRSKGHPQIWAEDEWVVIQGYQRHLLQAQYADALIGDLTTELRAQRIYDDAVIAVAADHGVAFHPGKALRIPEAETVPDIAFVPFFLKLPEGQRAGVSDDPVQTMDVLPSIADALDVEAPRFSWDGRSAIAGIEREVRKLFGGSETFLVNSRRRTAGVARKYELFGTDGRLDPYAIAPDGLQRFLGMQEDELSAAGEADAQARIANLGAYAKRSPSSDEFPWMLEGSLEGPGVQPSEPLRIAIAIGDKVRAITRPYGYNGSEARFYAMLPPDSFAGSSRDIYLYVLGLDGSVADLPVAGA